MSHGRGSGMAALRMGRPSRVPGARASIRRWCSLTPAEDAALVHEAAAAHLTPSMFIRDAVNAFVSDYSDRTVFTRPT